MKRWLLKLEWLVGGIAMCMGLVLQIQLMRQNAFAPGALMLILTGMMLCAIAWKDEKGTLYNKLNETLVTVIRRTLLFLNIMLALVVVITLAGGLG